MSNVLVRKGNEQFYVDASQAQIWENAGYSVFQPVLYSLSASEVQEISSGKQVAITSLSSLEVENPVEQTKATEKTVEASNQLVKMEMDEYGTREA